MSFFKWGSHTALTYLSTDITIYKYVLLAVTLCGHSLKFPNNKPNTLFDLLVTYSTYGCNLKSSLINIARYNVFYLVAGAHSAVLS